MLVKNKPEVVFFPKRMTKQLREWLITERFPLLNRNPEQHFYLSLFQYVLYTRFRDEETGNKVLPAEVVANCANKPYRDGEFSARDYMDKFAEVMFPLNYSATWDSIRGKARTIVPAIPSDVLESIEAERSLLRRQRNTETVILISGEPFGVRKKKAMQAEYKSYLDMLDDEEPMDHPAMSFLDYLNGVSMRVLRSYIKSNWEAMCDYVDALPAGPKREDAETLLSDIEELGACLRYGTCENTLRFYARGVNITQAPRVLRNIALAGSTHIDLKAAQLAICSKVYDCPTLREFLNANLRGENQGFWHEILTHLDLGAEYKPILKDAIYAICFGQKRCNTRKFLIAEIGQTLTNQFFNHYLVKELCEQREIMMKKVIAGNGMEDAYGRWIPLSYKGEKENPRSVLAQVAQSWEVKLITSILPIVESRDDVDILCFLHDGLYLNINKKERTEQILNRLFKVLKDEAQRLNIPTEFELN